MDFEGSKLSLIKKRVKTAKALDNPNVASEEVKRNVDAIKNEVKEAVYRRPDTLVASRIDNRNELCVFAGGKLDGSLRNAKTTVAGEEAKTSSKSNWAIQWKCGECDNACIPVRSESRCLCGHRLKEHKISGSGREGLPRFECRSTRCDCKHFFYIVAEGTWILRCRCKHKHTEHDCSTPPFRCSKLKCNCSGFDSPWVCNCGHDWSSHVQSAFRKEISSIPTMAEELVDELDLNYRKDGDSI